MMVTVLLALVASSKGSPIHQVGRKLLDNGQGNVASSGRSFFSFQTRRNYAGDSVSPLFCCWDDSTQTCNWNDYFEALSLMALPALCVGIFGILLFGIALTTIHSLRSRTSFRLCWTHGKVESIILRVVIAIAVVGMIGTLIAAFVGNSWQNSGVYDFINGMNNFLDKVSNVTNNAYPVLLSIGVNISKTQQQVNSAFHTYSSYKSTVSDYEEGRMIAFYAMMGIFLSFFLVTLGLLACKFRCSTTVNIFFSAIVMITIIFAMLILTILAGGVGDDVCSIYPLVEEGQSAPIVQKLISTLGQNCTTFEGALSPLEKHYTESVNQTCGNYTSFCSSCGCLKTCLLCNSSTTTNVSAIQNAIITETYRCGDPLCPTTCNGSCEGNSSCLCYNNTLTIKACATQCLNSSYRSKTTDILDASNQAITYSNTIEEINPYVGCGVLIVWSNATQNSVCVELMSGTFLLFLGTAIFTVPWCVFMVVLILISDRTRDI